MASGRATLANVGESLAAQAMIDLGERGSLGVRELQLPFQLRLQDASFHVSSFWSTMPVT